MATSKQQLEDWQEEAYKTTQETLVIQRPVVIRVCVQLEVLATRS